MLGPNNTGGMMSHNKGREFHVDWDKAKQVRACLPLEPIRTWRAVSKDRVRRGAVP